MWSVADPALHARGDGARRFPRTADRYVGRFLLLEDNPHQQRALRRRLEERRPVDLAPSISEARVRVASGVPYIGYVFDVNLPDGDGVELLSQLRERARITAPAVIITAGEIDRDIAARAGALGRLLPKPGLDLDPAGFLEGLEAFVDDALGYERETLGPRATLFDLSDGELTQTQMDVAELGVLGYSRSDIARELGITVHTVRSHIRDVLLKTGLRGQRLSTLARRVNERRRNR